MSYNYSKLISTEIPPYNKNSNYICSIEGCMRDPSRHLTSINVQNYRNGSYCSRHMKVTDRNFHSNEKSLLEYIDNSLEITIKAIDKKGNRYSFKGTGYYNGPISKINTNVNGWARFL